MYSNKVYQGCLILTNNKIICYNFTIMKNVNIKCDVVIPIYNAPDWVKLCLYSLFVNTPRETLGKVYLMNDNSDELTLECMQNLKEKYGDMVEIITNEENLGFVKNSNKGMKLTGAKYVLLLNSDCLLSKNTIPKLMNHMENDSKIGLISPVSNNSANTSLPMFEGFGFTQMNELLEREFKGKVFDACTITGNCLMISRKCIDKVGLLDEAYGMGYGEETDYQFKAMKLGFTAKLAIDTYVFHKAEVSFGRSQKTIERIEKNRELFFSRWGKEYEEEARKYAENEPMEYIEKNLSSEDRKSNIHTLFFLPQIIQNAGGCHTVVDLVNYLVINGFNANILYEEIYDYMEPMLFTPIRWTFDSDFTTKQIVATIWVSTFRIFELVKEKKVPLINYIQGYENYFENGGVYNSVILANKMADDRLVVSTYLKKKIKEFFDYDSTVISNGINVDLIKHKNTRKKPCDITFVMRGNMMKGDYLIPDIITELDKRTKGLNINLVYMSEYIEIPRVKNNKINKILGPISRMDMIRILRETDIYVDTSTNEGFGLIGLESIIAGAVPVMSDSFGIHEYFKEGINGLLVSRVNDSQNYVSKILELIENPTSWEKMRNEGSKLSKNFDYDDRVQEFIEFLNKSRKYKKKEFDKQEKIIIEERSHMPVEFRPRGISIVRKLNKFIPSFIRDFLKKVISWLYSLYV